MYLSHPALFLVLQSVPLQEAPLLQAVEEGSLVPGLQPPPLLKVGQHIQGCRAFQPGQLTLMEH